MAYRQSGLSRTLPKDFTFYTSEEDARPRTPEQPTKELTVPPPPQHSSCRFRRPRLTMENQRELFCSPDIPLPSIEFSHDPSSSVASIFDMAATKSITDNALQVPPRGRVDPRTPPAQIRGTPVDERPCWTYGDATDYPDSIQRPASACSNFSDSSVASSTSYTSHPSIGGSCTSPESEIQDPFLSHPLTSCKREKPELEKTPSKPCNVQEDPSNIKVITPRWTADMDSHLWNTYQIYLQDPRITPFKMVPGSLPPLGVSHRVAREARKTWPRAKNKPKHGPSAGTRIPVPVTCAEELGGNGKQPATNDSVIRSGSTTPTARLVTPAKPTWPRSDSSTRRRLKDLCKRKFSIAPHYQRLLQSRSPSPFLETFPESTTRTPLQLGASHRKAASFATRDLGVSLVSSSLPTQVAELGPPENNLDNNPESNWFNNISHDHEQQPLSSHHHSDPSSLDNHHAHSNNHINATRALSNPTPRLGSPFMYHTWGPDSSRRRFHSVTPANQCETIHATSLKTRSPGGRVDPFGNAHKRRALHQLEDELDSSGSSLQRPFPDLIRQTRYSDIINGQRRVRVRSRGVTTGAIGGSRGRLDQLFTAPAPFPAFSGLSTTSNSSTTVTATTATATTATATTLTTTTTTTEVTNNGQKGQEQGDSNTNNTSNINNNHHLRLGDDIKRLGSPFHSAPFNKYSNLTRRHHAPLPHSPRHAPSLSDPFISTTFASMFSTTTSERDHQHPAAPISNYQERSESTVTTPRAHFGEEREGKTRSGARVGMGMGVDGDVLELDAPKTPFS
ncbi:hypothetical protein AJ78_06540 [Emergomyces pasteurianus Ep9510]|uniref:Uncharacterized protein n=1 Tax=Emergomyces pasteurianus Ep9510 TaxID=1447872 RepID=A0A1J9PA41_9EURO|nr:hypothetical protein AJ78_06540 [Emergomyces pasteurianus Ep9510]